MHFRTILTALIIAGVPAIAHAESQTIWSFLGSQVGSEWRITGEANTTAEIGGLRIQPVSDIKMFREMQLPHRVDQVEITYLALRDTEAMFFWHRRGDPEGQIVQLPFHFTPTMVAETVKLDVRWYNEWDPKPDMMGILLPKGADVQILQFKLTGLSPLDKILAGIRSYWTFDTFTPYSINFLWGPVLSASPIAREKLFIDLPPHGTYANKVWYGLLIITVIAAFSWAWNTGDKRRATLGLLGVFAACWILSDLRMGIETMSYAVHDIDTYWSKPQEQRIFRERGDFPLFLDAIQPLVTDRGRYIFLTQFPYPFLGLIRYHTYPALPVAPEAITEGVDTWVVFERPDVRISPDGQLMADGKPISQPGEILFALRDGTFVFRTF